MYRWVKGTGGRVVQVKDREYGLQGKSRSKEGGKRLEEEGGGDET